MDKFTEFFQNNQIEPPHELETEIINKIHLVNEKKSLKNRKSKWIFAISFILIAGIIGGGIAFILSQSKVLNKIDVICTSVTGTVEIETQKGNIKNINSGDNITKARIIRTKNNSLCSITLSSGSTLIIQENTELRLTSVLTPKQKKERTNIEIFNGKIVAHPIKITGDGQFIVNTPASVTSVLGTKFLVSYNSNTKISVISVLKGRVLVKRKVALELSNRTANRIYSVIKPSINVEAGQSVEIYQRDNLRIAEILNQNIDQIQRNESNGHNLNNVSSVIRAKSIAVLNTREMNEAEKKIFANSFPDEALATVEVKVKSHGGKLVINGERVTGKYYIGQHKPGDKLTVVIKKKGYRPYKRIFIVPEGIETYNPAITLNRIGRANYVINRYNNRAHRQRRQRHRIRPIRRQRVTSLQRIVSTYKSGLKPQSDPIAFNNRVYFQAVDNNFYCIDLSGSGRIEWKLAIGTKISPPVLYRGKIYFGDKKRHLYAVNALNGSLIWKKKYGTLVFQTKPRFYNNMLYFGVLEGSAYAVNSSNGKQIWKTNFRGGIWNSIAVGNKGVYVGCEDENIYALDRVNGKILWKKQIGRIISPLTYVKNRIIAVNFTGKVFAFNLDGNKIWEKLIGRIEQNPVSLGNLMYFAIKGKLISVNTVDGKIVLNKTFSNKNVYFTLLGNRLFVSGSTEKVFELTFLGKEVWSHDLDKAIFKMPMGYSNYVFAISNNGVIFKLNRAVQRR